MGQIEDRLKKRYSNQEITNDGFDDDSLWSSIVEELDKPTSKIPKKNKNKAIWIKLALLILLLGLIICNPYKSETYHSSKQIDKNIENLVTNHHATNISKKYNNTSSSKENE